MLWSVSNAFWRIVNGMESTVLLESVIWHEGGAEQKAGAPLGAVGFTCPCSGENGLQAQPRAGILCNWRNCSIQQFLNKHGRSGKAEKPDTWEEYSVSLLWLPALKKQLVLQGRITNTVGLTGLFYTEVQIQNESDLFPVSSNYLANVCLLVSQDGFNWNNLSLYKKGGLFLFPIYLPHSPCFSLVRVFRS